MDTIRAVCWLVLILVLTFPTISKAQELTPEQRARLEAELARVEKEIAANRVLLTEKQKESASLNRDISVLNTQIANAKLQIKAKELEIQKLTNNIGQKVVVIGTLSERLEREKQSLAELLRQARELDQITPLDVAFSGRTLSDLLADTGSFNSLQEAVHVSQSELRSTKDKTGQEKVGLEHKRNDVSAAKLEIERQRKIIEEKEKEKKRLLTITKNQEQNYQQVIANKEQERQRIRGALFPLRNATAISFGQAYDIAKSVSAKTGVRPAFILAILKQESDMGTNVGTCNRPTDPPTKGWQVIMKPERDQAPYLRIVQSLGLSPEGQPLSCPIAGGWGGAMGPAQFIPSTWQSYISGITSVTGNNPPNPWNPQDAIAAMALFMRDLGAAAGTPAAERQAALRYYAGGNWSKPQNAFYGDSVMRHAADFQAQINILQ